MRSLIIYEVEHGETTDPISLLIEGFDAVVVDTIGVNFNNSTVRIDLPECFKLS
jgi:hypothetical protein